MGAGEAQQYHASRCRTNNPYSELHYRWQRAQAICLPASSWNFSPLRGKVRPNPSKTWLRSPTRKPISKPTPRRNQRRRKSPRRRLVAEAVAVVAVDRQAAAVAEWGLPARKTLHSKPKPDAVI